MRAPAACTGAPHASRSLRMSFSASNGAFTLTSLSK
jgi:hypothetical protein